MTTIDSYRACLIAFESNNDYQNSELAIKFDSVWPAAIASLTYKLDAAQSCSSFSNMTLFSSAKTRKLWLGKREGFYFQNTPPNN